MGGNILFAGEFSVSGVAPPWVRPGLSKKCPKPQKAVTTYRGWSLSSKKPPGKCHIFWTPPQYLLNKFTYTWWVSVWLRVLLILRLTQPILAGMEAKLDNKHSGVFSLCISNIPVIM